MNLYYLKGNSILHREKAYLEDVVFVSRTEKIFKSDDNVRGYSCQ